MEHLTISDDLDRHVDHVDRGASKCLPSFGPPSDGLHAAQRFTRFLVDDLCAARSPIADDLDAHVTPATMVLMALTTVQRFWSKVNKSNTCWLWTGSTILRYGYGQFAMKVHGRWTMVRAHRFAWETTHGPIPKNLHVLHKCDHPACVRPDHLWLGSQAENMADMRKKGRASPPPKLDGTKHPLAKLTIAQAQQAQQWHRDGVSFTEIGRRLGVSRPAAARAAKGISYVKA